MGQNRPKTDAVGGPIWNGTYEIQKQNNSNLLL